MMLRKLRSPIRIQLWKMETGKTFPSFSELLVFSIDVPCSDITVQTDMNVL